MTDKPKKPEGASKVELEDFYVPPGMDVLRRLTDDVVQGLPPGEKLPSYSRLGIAVRDYSPGQPLKRGIIKGPPPKPIEVDQKDQDDGQGT